MVVYIRRQLGKNLIFLLRFVKLFISVNTNLLGLNWVMPVVILLMVIFCPNMHLSHTARGQKSLKRLESKSIRLGEMSGKVSIEFIIFQILDDLTDIYSSTLHFWFLRALFCIPVNKLCFVYLFGKFIDCIIHWNAVDSFFLLFLLGLFTPI